MKILVTGAAGFIGSWVCSGLLSQGHTVIGVDSLIGGDLENVPSHERMTHEISNIANLETLTQLCRNCETVYHCAALAYEGLSVFSPTLVNENIVVGSVAVMTAAVRCGVKTFVNCSSMARYGNKHAPFYEYFEPEPVDPYGLAKLSAERQLNLLGKIHGVRVIHAVPHNVVGPRQKFDDPYRNVVSIMINRILQGKKPVIYGDGSQVRCFSFIGDVLPILLALNQDTFPHGMLLNVGPDENPVSILALAHKLCDLLQVEPAFEFYPGRPQEVKVAYCNSDRIRRQFGYKTRISLDEGLVTMIESIKARGGPKPFKYHLPIEITNSKTPVPKTWLEQVM